MPLVPEGGAPPGVVAVLPDGAVVDVVVLPDGAVVLTDGAALGPDATVLFPEAGAGPEAGGGGGPDGEFVRDAADPRGLFSPCPQGNECTTPNTYCEQLYPGGLCQRRCMQDSDCADTNALCVGGGCRPRCTVGGGQCALTESCVRFDSTNPSRAACFPSCYTVNTPPGVPTCNAGLQCDYYTPGGPSCQRTLRTGGRDGDPCTTDSDCAGFCVQEVQNGAPSGWLGGNCASVGRLPDRSLYQPGQPLPRSNCPEGTVALPGNGVLAPGDMAVCLPVCTADSDCRVGRRCNRDVLGLGIPPTNGFCQPIDCFDPRYRGMSNSGCPAGTSCRANAMMPTQGVCAR